MSHVHVRTLLAVVVGLCSALALPAAASAATGGISGTVTSASTGEPLYFIEVCAFDATTATLEECDSTFNGEYELEEVEEGSAKVEFFSPFGGYNTQWYEGKATFGEADPVPVTAGVTTEEIDAKMVETFGRISGTVTNATNGSGIGGLVACAQGRGETFDGGCQQTNPDGTYTISFLNPGSYTVEFYSPYKYNESLEKEELEGPNFVRQYYNGKAHREEADGVTVTEGSTTSSINASMQPGATISGTTTDAVSGGAVQGIYVCAWGAATTRLCAETDKDGNYSIATLPADSYKVEFQPDYFFLKNSEFEKEHWKRTDFPVMDYLRQYWNEKFSFEAAEPVSATGGQTVTGISAKMTKEVQPPPPVGTAKLHGKVKVKGSKVLVPLQCSGPGDCAGTLKLTARSVTVKKKKKSKGPKRSHKRSKTVLIGQKKFSIHGGTSAVVTVGLNSKGKALVSQAGGKGLKVTIGGSVKAQSVTIKGKAPKKKPKKPAKP